MGVSRCSGKTVITLNCSIWSLDDAILRSFNSLCCGSGSNSNRGVVSINDSAASKESSRIFRKPRVRLEVSWVDSERQILRVGRLIGLPPNPQDWGRHIHAIVELLVGTVGDLELFVHDAVARGLLDARLRSIQQLISLLESVGGVI